MHSVWTVYTLFITVNIVFQSQQMRAKKKNRKRELKNADTKPKRKHIYMHFFNNKKCLLRRLKLNCPQKWQNESERPWMDIIKWGQTLLYNSEWHAWLIFAWMALWKQLMHCNNFLIGRNSNLHTNTTLLCL